MRMLLDIVGQSLSALWAHKLRSFLTVRNRLGLKPDSNAPVELGRWFNNRSPRSGVGPAAAGCCSRERNLRYPPS